MSKIPFPRRKPTAGFGAPVFRNVRPAVDIVTAGLLIATLAFPALVVRKTNANAASTTAPVPYSAPPEPFTVASGGTTPLLTKEGWQRLPLTGWFSSVIAFTDAIDGLIHPVVPAGLENAKMPTLAERLMSKAGLATSLSTESAIRAPQSAIEPPPQPTSVVDFDFDNDGKADVGRWHSANTELKVKNSNGGSYSTFTVGSSGATLAPGDFNGDGKTDAAVFSAGTWTYKTSPSASAQTISWGTSGDIPVAGDYDGDGTTDAAIYRPSTNTWWILKSSGGSTSTSFGSSGDIVAPGDYDGDGKNDLAFFRPNTGDWHITGSMAGYYYFHWGIAIDTPVPADYDGDGKTDPAVFRPSTGTWYAYRSGLNNGSYYMQTWGNYADQPVPGDYDGDSKADYAIWRPTTGVWYILNSSGSSYATHALGVPGDKAVPSAYLKQVGGEVTGDALAAARLQPRNATGGTDLYSQNFSWGTSLVSLPGRAGLDAGFGISYNSLVWTKVGSAIVFDADSSNAGPGFRFGFPVIEPVHYDSDKALWSYIMVTPSGGRAEFRQTTVSNTYETADSSYTQLVTSGASNPNDPVESITIKVTTTDGTQMTYTWNLGAYRCTQIKDRNGNYITIAYDSAARLDTVTDTLGRVLTVNYDGTTGYPSTITQTWKTNNGEGSGTTTHTWATLTYTTWTVDTDFSTSLTVVGPPDDTVVNVLDKITYPDGSSTKFEYNGYLQVKKISSIAADSTSHVLNYVSTNLDSPSSSQTDCPRFTETRSWVENFDLNTSNVPQEVVVTNSNPTSATYYLPDSISGSASRIDVAVTGHPDGLYSRTYVGSSGWKEGLTLATEDCVGTNCSDRKRWTWTDWTQDNTSIGYILNPRVTESRVGDPSNTKRTTLSYHLYTSTTIAKYGLVNEVQIYDTDLSTVLKKSVTDYELGSSYTSRRILGLPSEIKTYGRETSGLNLMTKITYAYDQGNFSDSGLTQNITPTQHDATYDSTFITGRGNRTSVTRWNVDYPMNSVYSITTSTKYNTAGSAVAQISPWDGTNIRTVRIGYADSWSDGVSRTTYAYPTVVTDPGGSSLGDSDHSSTVKYRYDIGTNVEATSPAPAGNTYGKKTKRLYDSVGRLERNSVYINTTEHTYVRYEYPTNGIQSKVYSTLVDTDSDGADSDDEVLAESWADGAGRVRLARTPHTFSGGTTATWAGTMTEYDLLGRVKRQSVPTEVDSSWAATGDDATRGFLWTHQKYDWKGRVVRKINTDGIDQSTLNDSDVLISYEGCGCAGGAITTIESELVPRTDTTGNARRKQKVYTDILGREVRSETFEWNGSTVYSTIVNSYNGRDQVVQTRQYAGTTSSSTFQDSTAAYDGHGRLVSSHKPEQRDSSNNLKYTTYEYNLDDSVSTITDGRGAITSFTYNLRGLLVEKGWTVPSSEITDPPSVTFSYDNLGNRTQMIDGLGTVDYEYDSLSRLASELRDFTDNLTASPITGGKYELEYTYTLGGQLKSYTDAFGKTILYAHDKDGRLDAVTGTWSSGSADYADNPHYRAWGALSHLDYGNGTEMNVTSFNTKLQGTGFEVKKGTTEIIDKSYDFYADGALKSETDSMNAKFDKLFTYDHQQRMYTAKSGAEARGSTDYSYNIPFGNSYQYNVFGDKTGDTMKHFSRSGTLSWSYTNNRLTGEYWNDGYDLDGNQLKDADVSAKTFSYDAAGRFAGSHNTNWDADPVEIEIETLGYDGDGQLVKMATSRQPDGQAAQVDATYQIRSSVLSGEVIVEASANGSRARTFIRANGTVVATNYPTGATFWIHKDPAMHSIKPTDSDGVASAGGDDDRFAKELDNEGKSLGLTDPYEGGIPDPYSSMFQQGYGFTTRANGQNTGYTVDGVSVPVDYFRTKVDSFFGGIFGLVEYSAWMSIPRIRGSHYTVGGERMPWTTEGAEYALGQAIETGLPIVQHWNIVVLDSWAIGSVIALYVNTENFNLRNGDKKKLGKKDQQRYDGKRASLLKSLNNISDQCKKFLEAAGLSVNDVLNAVKLQRPFDGETSTISRGAAGTIDESEWEPGATEGFKQRQRDQTEASYFKHVRFTSAETGNYPGGKLGVSPADRSDVYFRPARGPFGIYSEDSGLKESIILHEALHSLTGLSDRKLLKLLTNEEVSTSSEASRKITSALKEHDCID